MHIEKDIKRDFCKMCDSENISKNISAIEERWKKLGTRDLESTFDRITYHEFQSLMEELYLLLHSSQAIRFFGSIFLRAGGKQIQSGKNMEDYMSEMWIEAYTRYDYSNGHLMPF